MNWPRLYPHNGSTFMWNEIQLNHTAAIIAIIAFRYDDHEERRWNAGFGLCFLDLDVGKPIQPHRQWALVPVVEQGRIL